MELALELDIKDVIQCCHIPEPTYQERGKGYGERNEKQSGWCTELYREYPRMSSPAGTQIDVLIFLSDGKGWILKNLHHA